MTIWWQNNLKSGRSFWNCYFFYQSMTKNWNGNERFRPCVSMWTFRSKIRSTNRNVFKLFFIFSNSHLREHFHLLLLRTFCFSCLFDSTTRKIILAIYFCMSYCLIMGKKWSQIKQARWLITINCLQSFVIDDNIQCSISIKKCNFFHKSVF